MAYKRLIDGAFEDAGQVFRGKNVVILHPQFRYHNVLADSVAAAVDCKVLLVTLFEPDATLAALWDTLTVELAHLYDVTLPPLEEPSPAVAAVQFQQAIGAVQPLLIVISAYDYASAAIHEFVAQAAALDAQAVAFVLDSRCWPHELIACLDNTDSVLTLPAAPADMLLDYLRPDNDRVLLEVHALGAGQVLINGRQVDQWDGALPRALFFYFVDRGMTTRDEVFTTFWPELSTREATNVFHVTKRKISEILNEDLTIYSSGFYRVSPNIDLYYDVIAFAEAVQNSAVLEGEAAETLLQRAIGLYERDFLRDFDQPWAVRRRNELRVTYVDALTALARIYEDAGKNEQALGLYNRAFGASPQREDLARSQMRLYQAAKQEARALAVYKRLVDELEQSLGVTPSAETQALAAEVKQVVVAD